MKLYPSLSEADFFQLPAIMQALDEYVDGYHIDIMDFHFVPNLSWGPALVQSIAAQTTKPLWLHFMVTQPEKLLPLCINQKNEYIVSVHEETISDWQYLKSLKKEYTISLGMAISPKTPLTRLMPFIKEIDHLLIMAVHPGFSGQQFLDSSWEKIDQAYQLCLEHNKECVIAVDGGIKVEHIPQLKQKNVGMVAAASAVFEKNTMVQNKEQLFIGHSSDVEKYIQRCIENIQKIRAA